MFERLARFVVYNPWKVIAVWVLATIAIVAFAPTLSDVTNRDQTNFLPNSYESVKAMDLGKQSFERANDSSATVVLKRADGNELSAEDQTKIGDIGQRVKGANIERVTQVVTGPQTLSPNKKVQLISVGLQGVGDDPKLMDAVKHIRETAKPAVDGTGLTIAVTGDAALFLD